jgi:hypothetical protein
MRVHITRFLTSGNFTATILDRLTLKKDFQ